MTVQQLISKLSQMENLQAEVVIPGRDHSYRRVQWVTQVIAECLARSKELYEFHTKDDMIDYCTSSRPDVVVIE